jgi:hypothetical protein
LWNLSSVRSLASAPIPAPRPFHFLQSANSNAPRSRGAAGIGCRTCTIGGRLPTLHRYLGLEALNQRGVNLNVIES